MKSEHPMYPTNYQGQKSKNSLSLIHSTRCAIDEMDQSSVLLESSSMTLDITQKKIHDVLLHDCYQEHYSCPNTEVKKSHMKRLSWRKSLQRRNMAKSRRKVDSQDSTTSEETDLQNEYIAVLNDRSDKDTMNIKASSEKRRKSRNCRKDNKKKMNHDNTKKDYFDLIIDDCDSDVSEITVEGFDYYENFESVYDCSSNEVSKSAMLPQDADYFDAKEDAIPKELFQRGIEKTLSRRTISQYGRSKEFLQDYSNTDCNVDSLINSSWREHLKVIDDWKQFTKQLSSRRIDSVLEANCLQK
jgi:hypothetical protein